jgi:type II secretory pathway component PulF
MRSWIDCVVALVGLIAMCALVLIIGLLTDFEQMAFLAVVAAVIYAVAFAAYLQWSRGYMQRLGSVGWTDQAGPIRTTLLIFGMFILVLFVAAVLVFLAFFVFGMGPGILLLALILLTYGWLLFAFLHYRHGRQDELLHLITTAVESGAPLVPALRAYVADRPQGRAREFWVALMLFFVLPGYYWVWHRRHNFDAKVARLADLLAQGVPLAIALRLVPGIAARETVLAATIGESTGHLAACLRNSSRARLALIWLEVMPRVLYPLAVLLFMSVILAFWMTFIGPRFKRIYADFLNAPLPIQTRTVMALGMFHGLGLLLLFACLILLVLILIFSPQIRWLFPGIGRLYQTYVQSRVLRMLAIILEAGKPIPEGIGLLVSSGYFAPLIGRRLRLVRDAVEQGEPLAESLRRGGLLPAAMSPLVKTAERIRNLPWVLRELGETLADRAIRRMRRSTMILGPAMVIALGALVGYVVVGLFIPLVDLITRLSE